MVEFKVDLRRFNSETKIMYFQQDRMHPTHENSQTRSDILIDYTGLVQYNFSLSRKYEETFKKAIAVEEESAYWVRTTKEHQVMLRTRTGLEHGAILFFGRSQFKDICLVVLSTDVFTTFDLVYAVNDDNPTKLVDVLRRKTFGWESRPDRLSLNVGEDVFVSAAMKMIRESETSDRLLFGISLSEDRYQRWPAPTGAQSSEHAS